MKDVDDEALEMALVSAVDNSEEEEMDLDALDMEREELGELSPEESEIIRMIRAMKMAV